MHQIEIGKIYEEKAVKILSRLGYRLVEHTSKIKRLSCYDLIVSKFGREYIVEVKGTTQNVISRQVSKRKILNMLKNKRKILILLLTKTAFTLYEYDRKSDYFISKTWGEKIVHLSVSWHKCHVKLSSCDFCGAILSSADLRDVSIICESCKKSINLEHYLSNNFWLLGLKNGNLVHDKILEMIDNQKRKI